MSRKDALSLRERYRDLFERSPSLDSVVLTRTALGRAVVDLERITGRNGSPEPLLMLAIYEVEDGKIRQKWYGEMPQEYVDRIRQFFEAVAPPKQNRARAFGG